MPCCATSFGEAQAGNWMAIMHSCCYIVAHFLRLTKWVDFFGIS